MIPLFKPACSDEEIAAVTRVMRSGFWGMGPETEAFEQEFAAFVGTRYAVATSSCTAALELAMRALELPSSRVITPSLTFASTAQAMQHAGKTVHFADVDARHLGISWDSVRELLDRLDKPSPPGLVPVWYGGSVGIIPPDVRERVGVIIEDCAHAAGSTSAGTQGDAACWSFHAVKNLAAGDGGMVTTNISSVAEKLRRLRWCGISKSTWDRDRNKRTGYNWDYDIPEDGFKMHMNDITAAIGRVQLRRLPVLNRARFLIACQYSEALGGLPWLRVPKLSPESSCHLFVVRMAPDLRPKFIDHMLRNGVSAGVHYKPLTHYPVFGHDVSATPVAEEVWQAIATLPLYPEMTHLDVEKVVTTVKSFR